MWDKPVPVRHLVLAPAERADVIADFRHCAGQTHYVTNTTPRNPVSTPAPPLTAVLQLRVGTTVTQPGPASVPSSLPGRRAQLPAPHRRRFITLNEVAPNTGNWTLNLNARDFETSPPTERPRAGTAEDWLFINMTGDTHPMHTHLVTHQVVGRTPFNVEAYRPNSVARTESPEGSTPPPSRPGPWNRPIPPSVASKTPPKLILVTSPPSGPSSTCPPG
jgi:spore coat protein A